jgi:Golgi nucleoside diphosphatase
VLLTGVHFLQYSEYWFTYNSVCVICVSVIFSDFTDNFKIFYKRKEK